MDLDDLRSKYKLMPVAARLLIAFLLGIIPSYYIYLEDGDALERQITEIKDKLSGIEAKFEKERTKRKKLPELEAKLAFTEQQLKESSKRLPESFLMNDILQETSSIARDVGVELQVFDPGTPESAGDAFKYMEMPIELIIAGKYNQVANFYDRLANLEKMVHIRNFKLVPRPPNLKGKAPLAAQNPEDSLLASQRTARADYQIQASAFMLIYRAMSSSEVSKSEDSNSAKKPGGPSTQTPTTPPPNANGGGEGAPPSGKNDEADLGLPPITGNLAKAAIESSEKIQ